MCRRPAAGAHAPQAHNPSRPRRDLRFHCVFPIRHEGRAARRPCALRARDEDQSLGRYSMGIFASVMRVRKSLASLAMKALNSAGVEVLISRPSSVSRLVTVGVATALSTAAFSLSMIGWGVPAGAITPSQPRDT